MKRRADGVCYEEEQGNRFSLAEFILRLSTAKNNFSRWSFLVAVCIAWLRMRHSHDFGSFGFGLLSSSTFHVFSGIWNDMIKHKGLINFTIKENVFFLFPKSGRTRSEFHPIANKINFAWQLVQLVDVSRTGLRKSNQTAQLLVQIVKLRGKSVRNIITKNKPSTNN